MAATMREITLKHLNNGTDVDLEYKGLILTVLSRPKGQGGADYAEMERSLAVQTPVRAATPLGSVLLSEENWTELRDRVLAYRWGAIVPEIKVFIEDIKNAPSVEVTKAD